jgi:hypothetical protein
MYRLRSVCTAAQSRILISNKDEVNYGGGIVYISWEAGIYTN